MNLKELVARRQSDRKFDPNRPIPRETIEQIIEVARLAPSATNSQPWHFVVVDDPTLRDQVACTLTSKVIKSVNRFATSAPVLLVLVEEPANLSGRAGSFFLRKHFPTYDIGIVASYITLAAEEAGIGSCIMGWLNQRKIRKLLGIPRGKKIPLVIALGYSLQKKRPKKRKTIEELLSYNKYSR